ncbi:MAG: sulfatase-like hydrolase/transferase [Thermoanaerobaculia bacterium]
MLISLDTLRADHLSAYGYERETSPFLARLAERATVFERVLAPYPATLVSHMSLFTGLYPQQHGVYPPNGVLAAEVPTLPERFRAAGFRTAGFTEGGFVAGGYGFARGFETFADPPYQADTDLEATLNRGLDFLRGLGPEERFFLFLHSYAIHDPYAPPAEFAGRFAPTDPGNAALSKGEDLRDFNRGRRDFDAPTVEDFARLYDGTILYADQALENFFGELERLGLAAETTVLVTSDHGEEFLEHRRLGHTQLYPESLFVPLFLVAPDQSVGVRLPTLARLVDLAPTLYDLAGIEAAAGLAGASLVPCLRDPASCPDAEAYAEVADEERNRTLIVREDGHLYQFHLVVYDSDPDGTWISRRAVFDLAGEALTFRGRSFHRPRTVRVSVDGAAPTELAVGVEWADYLVPLGGGASRHRLTLEADGCDVPAEVEEGDDERCLSLLVQGPTLTRSELFDLTLDPLATRDLSRTEPALHRRLARRLAALEWEPVGGARTTEISAQQEEMLRALGYVD